MKHFKIKTHEDGITLLKWMKANMPHITRGLLEKSIRKGWVKLDKKKIGAGDKLAAGQTLMLAEYLCEMEKESPLKDQYSIVKAASLAKEAKHFRSMIIYEDKDIIAINKPAGLAVQGGSGQKISVDSLAQSIATDEVRPRLVHRLDKDTSGVLILAKTAKSATYFTKLFASKDIEKEYMALVIEVPLPKRGRIDLPMIKSIKGKNSGMEKVDVDMEVGKDAVTLYEVIHSAANKYAWVKLYPITGRTHQLRVHMAAIDHPIVGDGKYGGARAFEAGSNLAKQLHLHAAAITFPQMNGKAKTIKAELPSHMQKAWDLTGGD